MQAHGIAGFALMLNCMLACGENIAMSKPDSAPALTPASATPPLDLRAPNIHELFTPRQIADVLAGAREKSIEEVEVEGERGKTTTPSSPEVWGAIAAPIWALLHPMQAWRIIAPIPSDRAGAIGAEPPDATSTQRAPAIPLAGQ